ncbi:MAG: hypothetical protein AAF916_11345, partial [Planctomycetota bacterium]
EKPTFDDRLREIIAARPHASFDDGVNQTLDLIRPIAALLLNSNAGQVLPPQIDTRNLGNRPSETQIGHKVYRLRRKTEELAVAVDQISKEQDGSSQRTQARDHLSKIANQFLDIAIPFSIALQNSSQTTLQSKLQEALSNLTKTTAEVEEIRRQAQDAAGAFVASSFSNAFSKQAKNHRTASWVYFGGLIAVAATLIAGAIVLLVNGGQNEGETVNIGTVSIVQTGLLKAAIFSVLYFLMITFARSYRAKLHLAAVNEHRSRSLVSFETFVKASNDEATRNAVLLETTRCIYSHTGTGFVSSGDDSQQSTHVVEMVKALKPNPVS